IAGFVIGRFYGLEGTLPASIGAAAAALFLCWPVIVFWDVVVTEEFRKLHSQFMTLYALYVICFFYVAKIGAFLGTQVRSRGPILSLNLSKISRLDRMIQSPATKVCSGGLLKCAMIARMFHCC